MHVVGLDGARNKVSINLVQNIPIASICVPGGKMVGPGPRMGSFNISISTQTRTDA